MAPRARATCRPDSYHASCAACRVPPPAASVTHHDCENLHSDGADCFLFAFPEAVSITPGWRQHSFIIL
eukprot:12267953-Alexandrium_andersonii.AAC.1